MKPPASLMSLAHGEAAALGHEWVGAEHILLALAGPAGGPAGRAMATSGLSHGSLVAGLTRIVPRGEPYAAPVVLPAGPSAKWAMGYAIEQARTCGAERVGLEHVLLGLLDGEGTVAVEILRWLGTDFGDLRAAVHREAGSG